MAQDNGFDDLEELDDALLCSISLDFSQTDHIQQGGGADTWQTGQTAGLSADIRMDKSNKTQELITTTGKSHISGDGAVQDTSSLDLGNVPDSFPFPFEPYNIQVDFMRNLYSTLQNGHMGIFESPTGTGKSLSLICGALTWLRDFEEQQRKELDELLAAQKADSCTGECSAERCSSGGELDWIASFAKKKEEDEKAMKLKEEQEKMIKREARLNELRNNIRPVGQCKRKRDKLEEEFDELFKNAGDLKMALEQNSENENADEDIVLAEYVSDDEAEKKASSGSEDEDEEEDNITKIYYCSRTHSQLAQFVREVQKSPFGDNTRVVSLGSRQNLCINQAVKKLNYLNLINETCLEMQKNKKEPKKKGVEAPAKKKKSVGGCPFYKQEPMQYLSDRVLVDIQDVEQLVTTGKQMKACPYYGTRYAVPAAQLVVLPYNTLLHKSTRESCGIKLKGNIVIIDEAHNVLDTISSIHSASITGAQIACAHSQLVQYQDRYKSRLKASNLMYIRQLLYVLNACLRCFGGKTNQAAENQFVGKPECKIQTINNFLFDCQLDNLNLFKIMKYCEKSQIARKLHGFVEKYQPSVNVVENKKEKVTSRSGVSRFLKEISQGSQLNADAPHDGLKPDDSEETTQTSRSPLMHILSFLEALTNADKDGRIVVNKQDLLSRCSLKFLLLNPSVHFMEVAREARSVIVAGGTMQPISEFEDQLFRAAGIDTARINHYACGHVISSDQLTAIALAHGSSGLQLDFTYQSRNSPEMLNEVGRVMYNVCNIVPGGVVCFFPSYEYERLVYSHWEKAGFLAKMCSKKKVFREPRKSSQVDQVLTDYSNCINKCSQSSSLTGALLLCVVGGKMSEGINFSDDLGRCVVMIGLPYPNKFSPELKEKMDYLDANVERDSSGKSAGQIHYENLCMKAVNQSIGRAIRHKNDYSAILLLDHRYLRTSTQSKLPQWICAGLQSIERFGPAFASLRKFFSEKKSIA